MTGVVVTSVVFFVPKKRSFVCLVLIRVTVVLERLQLADGLFNPQTFNAQLRNFKLCNIFSVMIGGVTPRFAKRFQAALEGESSLKRVRYLS